MGVRKDMGVHKDAPPSPPLSLPPFPLSLPPSVVPASAWTRKIKIKIKIYFILFFKFYLVVVAGLGRENFFSIFGFRFSIPKIPEIPELHRLREQSREKKKVFSA
jgi:hypothetical protein